MEILYPKFYGTHTEPEETNTTEFQPPVFIIRKHFLTCGRKWKHS